MPSTVHRCAYRWTVDMSATFNKLSGPPPPPPLKEERSGGRNLISIVDLGANASTVQMCAFVTHNSTPPPPTVKGRTVGGGPEKLVDHRSERQHLVVHLCTSLICQRKNHIFSENLGQVLYVGLPSFPCFLSPWGLGIQLSNIKDMVQHRSSCMFY
jgi:hypothetical protein